MNECSGCGGGGSGAADIRLKIVSLGDKELGGGDRAAGQLLGVSSNSSKKLTCDAPHETPKLPSQSSARPSVGPHETIIRDRKDARELSSPQQRCSVSGMPFQQEKRTIKRSSRCLRLPDCCVTTNPLVPARSVCVFFFFLRKDSLPLGRETPSLRAVNDRTRQPR